MIGLSFWKFKSRKCFLYSFYILVPYPGGGAVPFFLGEGAPKDELENLDNRVFSSAKLSMYVIQAGSSFAMLKNSTTFHLDEFGSSDCKKSACALRVQVMGGSSGTFAVREAEFGQWVEKV